jgi:hypothetical protein
MLRAIRRAVTASDSIHGSGHFICDSCCKMVPYAAWTLDGEQSPAMSNFIASLADSQCCPIPEEMDCVERAETYVDDDGHYTGRSHCEDDIRSNLYSFLCHPTGDPANPVRYSLPNYGCLIEHRLKIWNAACEIKDYLPGGDVEDAQSRRACVDPQRQILGPFYGVFRDPVNENSNRRGLLPWVRPKELDYAGLTQARGWVNVD